MVSSNSSVFTGIKGWFDQAKYQIPKTSLAPLNCKVYFPSKTLFDKWFLAVGIPDNIISSLDGIILRRIACSLSKPHSHRTLPAGKSSVPRAQATIHEAIGSI